MCYILIYFEKLARCEKIWADLKKVKNSSQKCDFLGSYDEKSPETGSSEPISGQTTILSFIAKYFYSTLNECWRINGSASRQNFQS